MKTNSYFFKNFLVFLFFIFTSITFGQSNNCAATPTLTIGTTCVTTNYNVTNALFTDSGVTESCTGTSWRDGWYTFTTGATTTQISIDGTSNRQLGLALYSGACGSLSEVTCTIPNNANASLTNITVSPNTTYRLRLMRTNNANPNNMVGTVCVIDTTAPSTNFTCATATSLPCGTTALAGTTVGSTGSTAHGTGCSMSNYGAWYTFVGDGQLTTISTNPAYDIELSVSSGSCGSFTNIVCSDSAPETATFSTTNGVNYYVYVAHYSTSGSTTGTFTISRTCSAPIANDNCSGAVGVSVNPTRTCTATTAGTIFGATDSGVTGSTCGGTDDDDVWYSFVATASTHYIELLNVAGNTTDLYHAVYSGACGSLGAAIVCSDPNTSTVTGLTPGNTYYIQIYSWGSTSGRDTTFDVCISTDPPCSGTPTAGTATTSPSVGNPGSSYTVSATGYPTNVTGLTFQWQYSTNGGGSWTNQDAATGTYSNYTATAPALGTTVLWHLIVTCGGNSATSSNGTFTSVSTLNVPTTGSNTVTCGTNVVLYDNGGPSGDYAYSSTGYTVLEAGLGATININGNYDTESGWDYVRIYSGTGTGGTLLVSYSGVGSINYTGTAGQTLTVQFTSDSLSNYSGFSLSVTYSGACYTACSGTPTGGTVTTNPNSDWPGANYVVSATGYTQALNLTYQWQYSTDAGSTWTNAGAATSSYADYNATAPASGDVHWQLVVTCTNSSLSDTSTEAIFVTMAVSDVETGCPNVVSGGLGLNGADPAIITCLSSSGCVDLEATYLDLGNTTSYIVEPIAYNPPRAFNGLANPVSVNTDDVWSPIVPLPFDFCFYGNTYNQCVIGSNGILSFNTALAGNSSGFSFDSNIPVSGNTVLRENSIFGVFHDINPGVGTLKQVGWELITLPTGCQALVASWSNVPMFDENAILYTGMMVLYENSNIIEVYIKEKNIDNFGAGTWNDGNAIVGIQNATGTMASVPPGRNGLDANWTATNEAWRFVPNGTSIASIKWHEGSGVSGPVVGTTDVISVCPTNTTIYTAEITYTLCDGRTITELDETTVTVNKDKTWNGSTSTDWNVASNWTPSGVPTAAQSVNIPNVTNDPIVGAGADALACSLSIENGGVLTINAGENIIVTNTVTVAAGGTFNVKNSASLIQVNNVANSGIMNMERTANIRKLDYVYWSSPVTFASSFSSGAISPLSPTNLIFKWTPTIASNVYGFGNWTQAVENMAVGKGYIVRGPNSFTNTAAPFTATFIGTPNNGNITAPIQRGIYDGVNYNTMVSTSQGTKVDDNWNLLGNPYPSAINAISFLTANTNIDGQVKIWTHGTLPSAAIIDPFYDDYVYNYTVNDYITYNSSGASTGPGTYNGFIPAGQGFFVSMKHTSASTNETVLFNNSMRSSTYTNSQFFRTAEENSATNEEGRIWLDIVNANGLNVRTLVAYVEGATNERDRLFDAFTDNKTDLNLYSNVENEHMIIQGRTLPFEQNDQVPMGIKVAQDGTYTITIAAVEGLFSNTSQNIYIEDTQTNIIHDLRQSPYTFSAVTGNHPTRFVLRYTSENLGNDDFEVNASDVIVISNDVLTVQSTKNGIKSITIHDVIGRLISKKENVNATTFSFTTLQKNNTALLLKIELENGIIVNKKVIF